MARDYKKEYKWQGTPEQIKRRSSRNKARRLLIKRGHSLNGKDVDHKDGNPLNNSLKNLRISSVKANRSRK
jgi:hypothetical protein